MKTIVCYALLLLVPFVALCQADIPDYGKIDKADLELTDCPFDAGAAAFKLLDYGKVRFGKSKHLSDQALLDPSGTVKGKLLKVLTERRVRIKILKKEGIEQANVTIPFFTNDEDIKKVSACTYQLDANGKVLVTDVRKDGIYTKKISKNTSHLIIVLPNVQVGSVIEYKYLIEAEDEFFIRDWYFQSESMPTRLSYYDVYIPLTHGYGEEAFINHPSLVKNSQQLKETYGEGYAQVEVPYVNRVFYLKDVKSIKDEPYSGAVKDYLQRVYYHSVGTNTAKNKDPMAGWRNMANRLSDVGDYDTNVMADIKDSEALLDKARQQKDTAQKVKVIFDYLRNNFTCTQQEDVFPNEGAATVWQKRSGTIADINLLLVNLLQKAGVNALVMIGSTYGNGLVSTNYPSVKQFNVLMAYVPMGSGYYVLNAADNAALPNLVPRYMLGTKGLVINGDESFFVNIADNGQVFMQIVQVDIAMDNSGKATGKALINSYGYAKAPRLQTWLHNKNKFGDQYLAHPQFSLLVDSLKVRNEQDDTQPLEQQCIFAMPVNSSGTYQYLNTNLFTGLTKNPFTDDERRMDVEFRYKQSYQLQANITIPDGYVFDELPPVTELAMPNNGITCRREVAVKGKTLTLKIILLFNQTTFGAKDYGFLKDFYKKLFNLLEEQVVVQKK